MDRLRGTSVPRNDRGEAEWEEMERVLREKIGARLATDLEDDTRHIIDHPEEHMRILKSWAKVVWMKRWTFQKLFSRALARERHEAHFAELSFKDSVRVRSSLGGGLPLLTVPSSASRSLTNEEYLWYANARLGKKQPSVHHLNPSGDALCSCAARTPIGNGHHLRVCRIGGGHITVHNILRDVLHAMSSAAGLVAHTEPLGILYDGNERPADVNMVGTGVGRFGEDLCVDCCVIDPTAGIDGLSQVMKSRRTWELAHAATMAEKAKRRKRRSNDPGGLTMEQRVRNAGKLFYPVGFEILGATTESCKKLIKKLSEKAHDRRGHHKATFYRYWTTEIAMCLAKRGAQVALARTFGISAENHVGVGVGGGEDGPLGAPDAEPYNGEWED